MADVSADVAEPVDRARERLENAVARLEAAFAGASAQAERDRRDAEALRAENAELRRARDSQTSRKQQLSRRLDKAIEHLRAALEE